MSEKLAQEESQLQQAMNRRQQYEIVGEMMFLLLEKNHSISLRNEQELLDLMDSCLQEKEDRALFDFTSSRIKARKQRKQPQKEENPASALLEKPVEKPAGGPIKLDKTGQAFY